MTSTEQLKARLACSTASMLVAAMGLFAAPAAAQDAQKACAADQIIDADGNCVEEKAVEEVVITGSRIRRSEFSSASPIQIISGDVSREIGMFKAEDLLQTTTQSTGTQIDNTFGGFVLDNGPGSSQIGLRGLNPARTLVLLNGRRLAPAGVGGAPTTPDLNLIPSVMIDRVDILLDGASTVYGSDAVAGVANAVLRTDVEGFDVELDYAAPLSGGGETTVASVMWGTTSDRGHLMVGAEFFEEKAQSVGENPFTDGCTNIWYETEDGRKLGRYRSGAGPTGNGFGKCDIFPLTNRIQIPIFWGSVYRTPGYTNTGIPNYSESTIGAGLVGFQPTWIDADTNGDGVFDNGIVDGNGDGLLDFDFQDPFYGFEKSAYAQGADFTVPLRRYSAFSTGEYNLQDDNDTTFFFEALYAKREQTLFSPGSQLFEWVPASNPYNPCGDEGVDCLGVIGVPVGSQEVRPIINIRGDRDTSNIDVYQYRLLGGVRGNIGALDKFGEGNWAYEAYASYSYSHGVDTITGISEPRLLQSLDATRDGNGNVVCTDTSGGCVAVNLFGDNIFQEGGGTLTDAEAAYLFVERRMETTVEQTMGSGYITGDLFRMPWNDATVPLVFGYEFRRDSIASNPNDVASEGLLWGWFVDQGADGSRDLHEFFVETELPLLRGQKLAEELTITASARWTDESYYSPAETYSLKGIYRPVEFLTFRGTYGTSYRAPNLRERFLNGTTGFNTLTDPCVVPDDARTPAINPDTGLPDPSLPATYDPTNDNRSQRILNSCAANGVDPTSLGLDGNFFQATSVEISTGGSTTLKEERSTAYTYGVVLEQPWFDSFDLSLSATYYSIDIEDAVAEPGARFMIDRCYDNADEPNGTSAFCERITRNAQGRISLLDASFVNIGQETSKGWDFNILYKQDFEVAKKTLGVTLDLRATRLNENLYQILDDITDFAGQTEAPNWRANGRLILDYGDFRMNWMTRWIQGGEETPDEFDDGYTACDGLGVACRPVYYTTNYVVHDASLRWTDGKYSATVGMQNVFNARPPKVDNDGVFSAYNIPLGVGYDIKGRTVFFSLGAKF